MSQSIIPSYIDSLKAYSSAKSEKLTGTTWLNANESPYAKSFDIDLAKLNRYPDPQPECVINNYAKYTGLNPENIIMTRGADEGIELLTRTFCESGKDSITQFLPTYGMYKVTADSANVTLNDLTQDDLHNAPVAELVEKSQGTKLVFVCNPNNPTGATVSLNRINEIAAAFASKALVIVDEAYIEFCPELSAVSLIQEHSNVVVLRTLSKAFALAGLRTGFVLTNPELASVMRKVLAPYPVSGVVAAIAEQATSSDNITSVKRQVTILNDLRAELSERLKACDKVLDVLPSQANFVTLKLTDAKYIKQATESGLIMRPFVLYGEDTWLRISIGSEQELSVVYTWLNDING